MPSQLQTEADIGRRRFFFSFGCYAVSDCELSEKASTYDMDEGRIKCSAVQMACWDFGQIQRGKCWGTEEIQRAMQAKHVRARRGQL